MSDLQEQALADLANQYSDSPNLRAVLSLFVGEAEVLRDAALSISDLRLIGTAEGDGLDVIGDILGQPRDIVGVIDVVYFEYHDGLGGDAAEGFGDTGDASAGSRYRSIFESPTANSELADPEYRQMLEAKIVRDKTNASPTDIIASIRAVLGDAPFPTGPAILYTSVDQLITFTVQRVLSVDEINLLNANTGIRGEIPVIPRCIGIEISIGGL